MINVSGIGRPRRRWEDNINIDLQDVERDTGWILCFVDRESLYYLVNFIPPCISDSHPHRITSTKCRINTVISPDDGHIVARNM
jgi:hypothetical protein